MNEGSARHPSYSEFKHAQMGRTDLHGEAFEYTPPLSRTDEAETEEEEHGREREGMRTTYRIRGWATTPAPRRRRFAGGSGQFATVSTARV